MTDPFAESDAALRQHAPEVAPDSRRYREIREGMAKMSVTETSPDGRVTLTVDPEGVLTDLRLDGEDAGPPGLDISATVLITLRRAQSRLSERAAEIIGAMESDPDAADRAHSGYQQPFPAKLAKFSAPIRAENGSLSAYARR